MSATNYTSLTTATSDISTKISGKTTAKSISPTDVGEVATSLATAIFSRAEGFDTVAGMIAATDLVDGSPVATSGYTTAGDGGGNEYIYHSTGAGGVTEDGGFYILSTGVSGAYFEAVDKTVAYVSQFGGKVGGGSGDATTNYNAINSAITAMFARGGGVVKLMQGEFYTNQTVHLQSGVQIEGYGGYLDGSHWLTTINDGTAALKIDNLDFWRLSGFCLTAVNTNAIGIQSINTSTRFYIDDVHVRLYNSGYELDGWIGTMVNAWCTTCTTGMTLSNVKGGFYDLSIENCDYGLILSEASACTISCTVEGADGIRGIQIDDCVDILLSAPYCEFSSTSGFEHGLIVGETTECRGIRVVGGHFYNSSTSATEPLVKFHKSVGCSLEGTYVWATYNNRGHGVELTSSTRQFLNQAYIDDNYLQDDQETHSTVNLFPNNLFEDYLKGFTYSNSSVTLSRESAQGTPLLRNGREAIRLTCASGLSSSRTALILPSTLVSLVKGKYVTFGVWVYVPTHDSFTLTTYPTNTNLLPAVLTVYDGVASTTTISAQSGYARPGGWNFVWLEKSMSASATSIELRVSLFERTTGSTTSDGTEYIVIDSAYFGIGRMNPRELMALRPIAWDFYSSSDSVTYSATPTFKFDEALYYNKAITLTGNVTGAVLQASKAGTYRIIITQDGTGSRTFAFATSVNGTAPTLASSASAKTLVELFYDGSAWHYAN